MVEKLLKAYPEFKSLYRQICSHCRNIEEVLRMFSEELRELDRNTVQLMIDEMQEELEEARRERDKAREAVELEQQERAKVQEAAQLEQKHLKERIKQLEKQIQEK